MKYKRQIFKPAGIHRRAFEETQNLAGGNDKYPGATGSNKYGLAAPGRHAYARPVIFNYEGFTVCNLTAEE